MDILAYDYYDDNLVLLDESCEEVVVETIEWHKDRARPSLGYTIYFFANIDTEI